MKAHIGNELLSWPFKMSSASLFLMPAGFHCLAWVSNDFSPFHSLHSPGHWLTGLYLCGERNIPRAMVEGGRNCSALHSIKYMTLETADISPPPPTSILMAFVIVRTYFLRA